MNIQDISKDLLKTVSNILEKKSVKEVDEPKAKGEKDFKDLHTKDVEVHTEKKKKNECTSEKDFKPHMMYDPETGKGYEAKTYDDHVRMDKMGYTHEKPEVKEVDEPTAKGEKDFKDLHLKDLEVYTEKLDPKADAGEWIEDFLKSDAPQFKGKSKEERKKMALAAYFSAREKAGLDESPKNTKKLDPKDVEAYLVKTGVNPKDAKRAVKKGFDYASKMYGGAKNKNAASVKKVADVIWTLHETTELEEGADSDVKGDKEEYQKFFQGMLKKFGVKSPAELSGDKEKEFYNAIDAGWKADDEKKEETIEESKEVVKVKTHTPAAAQRLFKKLRNKFSGFRTPDDIVNGDEVTIPNSRPIIRYIEKQPEVADIEETFEESVDEGFEYKAEELKEAKNLMPAIQKIVDDKGAAKVGGVMVDIFTASVLTQAYAKVNDANKKKMESSNIQTLVKLAQKVMGLKTS